MNTPRNLGLYGGSFDPVHRGHLLVAHAAREELGLDRLFLVPAAQSPFKPDRPPTPAAIRVQLLRLALAGLPWCEVDEQEVARGGISYTIDTVRAYAARFPGSRLFYLIGADHIEKLPQWRDAEQLAARVEFVVLPRPGEALAPLPPPFRGHALSGYPLRLSSSQIRERVKSGREISHLVPRAVAEAIHKSGLYL